MKIIEGTPEEIRDYENKEHGDLKEFLNTEPKMATAAGLEYPDKVTFKWLKEHVPIGLWFSLLALLATLYIAGVQSSKISLVQEIFEVCMCAPEANSEESPNEEQLGSE